MTALGQGVGTVFSRGASQVTPSEFQYIEYVDSGDLFTLSGTVTYTDGTTSVRKVIRGGAYCVDKTLPGGTFAQSEGVGWVNLIEHYSAGELYKYGFLSNEYVVQGWTGSAWETIATASIAGGDNEFRDGVTGTDYVIDEKVATVYTNIETHS